MKQLALLQYIFLFEPGMDTWVRGFDFENDLDGFFSAYGYDMDVVDTTGGSGTRAIYLTKKQDKLEALSEAADKPAQSQDTSMAKVLDPLRATRDNNGKYSR